MWLWNILYLDSEFWIIVPEEGIILPENARALDILGKLAKKSSSTKTVANFVIFCQILKHKHKRSNYQSQFDSQAHFQTPILIIAW